MNTVDSYVSLESQFDALSEAVNTIKNHLATPGNEEDLTNATLPHGLDPAFVGHLMAVVRAERARTLDLVDRSTGKDIATNYVAIAGSAGNLRPPWRFLYLANIYQSLGLSKGGPFRRI